MSAMSPFPCGNFSASHCYAYSREPSSRNNTTLSERVCLAAPFNPAETTEVQLFRELAALSPIRLNNLPGTPPLTNEVSVPAVVSLARPVVVSLLLLLFFSQLSPSPSSPATTFCLVLSALSKGSPASHRTVLTLSKPPRRSHFEKTQIKASLCQVLLQWWPC